MTDKGHPWQRGGTGTALRSLNLGAWMGLDVNGSSGASAPEEISVTHFRGDLVCPRAGLGVYGQEKIFFPPPGFEPRTVQPVASHTDYAVLSWASRPSALCWRCFVSVLRSAMTLSLKRNVFDKTLNKVWKSCPLIWTRYGMWFYKKANSAVPM